MSDIDRWPLTLVSQSRMVAILRLDDLKDAVALSRALLAGGISVLEFTLTNPDALTAITAVRKEIAEFSSLQASVGVGSVRSVEQAKLAQSAGAQFVVTPTLNLAVVDYCVEQSLAIFPGAMTPSEISTAWERGASAVKVFPARMLGPSYLRDVLAPMPELRLLPTGGVDLSNMRDYFAAGAFAVGVGGNLLDKAAVASKDWAKVTGLARQYASAARSEGMRR